MPRKCRTHLETLKPVSVSLAIRLVLFYLLVAEGIESNPGPYSQTTDAGSERGSPRGRGGRGRGGRGGRGGSRRNRGETTDIFANVALMFADDVASFSDTIVRLQHQINCIETFCLSVGMQLNLLKTKIIVFRNGGVLKQTEKWFYMGAPIDVVSFYKYLGVHFTPKLVWSKTKEVLALQASKAVFKIFQYQRQFGYFCPKDIFLKIIRLHSSAHSLLWLRNMGL